uniref:DUF4476 domain-containing protein n=1 Tax=Stomoxys calcitrans TaxID=35570 RepID=A0A1I8PHI7_STOCA
MRFLVKTLQLMLFVVTVYSYSPMTESPALSNASGQSASASISPEIVNELIDFQNLIPTSVVDAIVVKHYVIDGNFRTALQYLRSNAFTQFQKQLLDVPEIIGLLDFLHMVVNATTIQGAASSPSPAFNDNGMHKIPTNSVATATATGDAGLGTNHLEVASNSVLAYQGPQFHGLEYSDDDVRRHGHASEKHQHQHPQQQHQDQPLVDIVLLDTKLTSTNDHSSNFIITGDGHSPQHRPLGSFTTFVAEIIGELPQPAYQHMITAKCKKNAKFADFYKALRSAEFKPRVDEAMKTPNIQKIIKTLSSHKIDVKSLEPIAFKVISWGPNV